MIELHKNYEMFLRCPVKEDLIKTWCNFYLTYRVGSLEDIGVDIINIFHNGIDILKDFSYNHIKHIEGEILVQMLGDYYVCE